MRRFFKVKNFFLISFLAVAGIFSATAIIKDKQVEETPVVEKADAASSGETIYFTVPSSKAYDKTPNAFYWSSGTGDQYKPMTYVYTTSGNNPEKVYKYTFPSGVNGFKFQYFRNTDQNWGVISEWREDWSAANGKRFYDNSGAGFNDNFAMGSIAISTFSVAFNKNGGTGTMTNQTGCYCGASAGDANNLKSNSFTRSGYTFTGWNTQADGKGTPYNDGAFINKDSSGTITLYAQWRQHKNVTIYFDSTPLKPSIGSYKPYMCYSNDNFVSDLNWVEGTLIDSDISDSFWYFPTKTAVDTATLKYYFNFNSGTTWRSLAVDYGEGWNLAYPSATTAQYTTSYESDGSIISIAFYKRIDGVDSPTPHSTDYFIDGLSYNLCAPVDVLGSETDHNLSSDYLDENGNTVSAGWKEKVHSSMTLYGIYTWTKTLFVCNSSTATSGTAYGLEKNTDSEYVSATVVRIEKGQYLRRTDNSTIKSTYYMGGADSDFSNISLGDNQYIVLCNKTGAYVIKNRAGDYGNWNDIYVERDNEESALLLAKIFNDVIHAICVDIEGGTKGLAQLQAAWYSNTSSVIYNHFYGQPNAVMLYFKNATANEYGTELEQAAARYDKIERNYGVTALPNFLGRNASSYKPAIGDFSPFNLLGEDGNNLPTVIIIIASSVALLSITALSVLMVRKRKRKEE